MMAWHVSGKHRTGKRDCNLPSGHMPLHHDHWCRQEPSPASSLRLIWVPAESTSLHSCLRWIPSQFQSSPFVSKEHKISTPFLIYPRNSLTAHQVYTVCRCEKGGRTSPMIYKQPSSPILSSLHPICALFFFFLEYIIYTRLCILLILHTMEDDRMELLWGLSESIHIKILWSA